MFLSVSLSAGDVDDTQYGREMALFMVPKLSSDLF